MMDQKSHNLVSLAITLLLTLCVKLPGQWEILNEGVKGSIDDFDFINDQTGWIAGGCDLLLKTEDGGQSWQNLPQGDSSYFRLIDFVNDTAGWAVCGRFGSDDEKILKTTDGGVTWETKKIIPDIDINRVDILFAIDAGTFYTLLRKSGEAYILKASEGGDNWEKITLNNQDRHYYSCWFFNKDSGLVAGGMSGDQHGALLLRTYDGGRTWLEKTNPDLWPIDNLYFIDDSTGFCVTTRLISKTLYKTENAFRTWPTRIVLSSQAGARVRTYAAINHSTIYAIVYNPHQFTGYTDDYILKSTDGGRSWETKYALNWGVNKIYFSTTQLGIMISSPWPFGVNIFRTSDGGDSWTQPLLTYPFNDVQFKSKEDGIACGGHYGAHFQAGNVFVTHDGGRTWSVRLNTSNEVNACQFIGDTVGMVLAGGLIGRTFTGGETWATDTINLTVSDSSYTRFSGFDFCFINDRKGWAAGNLQAGIFEGAAVIATGNSGDTWDIVWKQPQHDNNSRFHSVCAVDTFACWAAGDEGLLVKCSDGVQWEIRPKLTDLPLNKIYFIDENYGWLSGGYLNWDGYQKILFRTIDGGETWQVIPNLPYLIYDIYFYDHRNGWAVGTDRNSGGIILTTNDGGDHWTVDVSGLAGQLRAITGYDNYLWAVGDYGLVLRSDITTMLEPEEPSHLPGEFELFQNYPNPFNPGTVISYRLPVKSRVELSIYNLIGQKVATLVSQSQPAGLHKVEWDASGFASGIYFYQLKMNGHVSGTKKLILIK